MNYINTTIPKQSLSFNGKIKRRATKGIAYFVVAFALFAVGGGLALLLTPDIPANVPVSANCTIGTWEDRDAVFYYLEDNAPEKYDCILAGRVEMYRDTLMIRYDEDGHTHYFDSPRIAEAGLQIGDEVPIFVVFMD